MLSCQQASRLLSDGQDRKLSTGERWRLRLHLAMCDGCRQLSMQFQQLRLLARRQLPD